MDRLHKGSEDQNLEQQLDALWVHYRAAHPDREPAAEFMPALWRRVDAQRKANSSWLRHWVEWCVGATAVAALWMGFYLIPSYQSEQPYQQASYVEALSAADSANDTPFVNAFMQAEEERGAK